MIKSTLKETEIIILKRSYFFDNDNVILQLNAENCTWHWKLCLVVVKFVVPTQLTVRVHSLIDEYQYAVRTLRPEETKNGML